MNLLFVIQRQNVESIAGCRELCIQATNYVCRSATYYSTFQTCKLSEESRRSAPASFRPAARGTFYLENECAVCKLNHYLNQFLYKKYFTLITFPRL